MARPLRIAFEGAWYHVMNRGAAKRDIFHSDQERYLFIELLERIHQRYKIEIHAYCLMDNHYHLLVRTPLPNISQAIKYLNGVFAQRINSGRDIDGPLFRGRFKTKLVDTDEYLTHLSRYIHLNPTEAKMCALPWEYKWSSCSSYIGIKCKSSWLFVDEILDRFRMAGRNKYLSYSNFLLDGNDACILDFFKNKFPVVGKAEFFKNVAETYLNEIHNDEMPEAKLLKNVALPSIDEVSQQLCKYFHIKHEDLLNSAHSIARNIFIYIAIEICNKTILEVASLFPNIKKSRVSIIHNKVYKQIKNDVQLKDEISFIVSGCGK